MAKVVRITKLTDEQVEAYCKANGWKEKNLPCGFPDADEVREIAEENAPDILEEAFEHGPNQTVFEYVALRICNDDNNNENLWDELEKTKAEAKAKKALDKKNKK
jgi:hypothetical protein